MTTYSRFCYQLIGDYIKPIKKYFLDLRDDLHAARMKFTLDEYLSMAVFTSILVFVMEMIGMSVIFGILFG
ncbi:MAG: hypothetical protein J7L43_02195, partial [Candidatus Aenigmarchaeota archaeon]|nr:hypothetical protein [Candidatus Aenigmarchaeota archaeon]